MIVVSLVGLKKCGKTTTAEALISEFKSRGMRVGGVKWMVHSSFTIDTEGKDTWRQKKAGADFVISMSENEMAFVQNRPERPGFDDVLGLVPEDTEVLVCKGLEGDIPGAKTIVLAKSPELLEETMKIRGTRNNIIALSGMMANQSNHHQDYPVFNCTRSEDVKALADLILEGI